MKSVLFNMLCFIYKWIPYVTRYILQTIRSSALHNLKSGWEYLEQDIGKKENFKLFSVPPTHFVDVIYSFFAGEFVYNAINVQGNFM